MFSKDKANLQGPNDASSETLPTGKLVPSLLTEHVLGRKGRRRTEIVVPAAVGEDATVIDLGGDLCVAAVDPITGATVDSGWLAVHVSCNDVAAHGARPVAVLLTILLPEGSSRTDLINIMAGAEKAAQEVGVEIAGGHTEVTPGLTQPMVTATAIGRTPPQRIIRSSNLQIGDYIWMSKSAGLEGTAIIAAEMDSKLRARVDAGLLAAARRLSADLSIVPEALAAVDAGVTAMHDVTEGGVLGALWEMATAAQVGLEVFVDQIPIHPATNAICSVLHIDPLKLISSGVLLAAAPAEVDLTPVGGKPGVRFTKIARAVPLEQGRWLLSEKGRQPLEPPQSDELWRVKIEFGDDTK